MAATVSHIADSVMGNMRVEIKKVTYATSSNTADVQTGMNHVDFAIACPLEGGLYPAMRFNSGVAGTATGGLIALSSGISATSLLVIAFNHGGK